MVRTTEQAQARTRARLLEAAAEAFARVGLDAANINEISLAAGSAKGTVYNYFPSKEALFLAVVEEACARTVADAEDPGAGAPTAERLRAVLASDLEWARRHESFARVLVRELFAGKPELYGRVVEAASPFVERVAEILRDGVARAEVRDDVSAEQLALTFTGLGILELVQHWGTGGTPSLDDIPDVVTDLFLEGARPRPPSQRRRKSGAVDGR